MRHREDLIKGRLKKTSPCLFQMLRSSLRRKLLIGNRRKTKKSQNLHQIQIFKILLLILKNKLRFLSKRDKSKDIQLSS